MCLIDKGGEQRYSSVLWLFHFTLKVSIYVVDPSLRNFDISFNRGSYDYISAVSHKPGNNFNVTY